MPYRFTLFFTFFLAFCYSSIIFSQASISGTVLDFSNAEGVAYANVLLLNVKDSSLINGDLTDADGNFLIEGPVNEPFLVSVSFLGFDEYTSSPFVLELDEQKIIDDIILSEGVALQEVEIVARKPLFEQKIDRLVVNVSSSSAAAGGTALEVLERSPGVIVNRQNNSISLVGKEGVVLMINGKLTYQPTESIVQMLEGMSSDNIESIELITTPPANFDAEGNAGFINIVLKSRTDFGLNGNTSVSLGYGEGETGSANLNLNYRNKKFNLFGSYSYRRQAQKQVFYNYRDVTFQGVNTISEVTTDRSPLQSNHSARLGIDYEVSGTIVGVLLSAYDNKWTMDAQNSGMTQIDNVLSSRLNLINDERNQWKNFSSNVNVSHKISDLQKINFNIDYLIYEDENPNNYLTQLLDPSGNITDEVKTRGDKYTPINIKVGQFDYENTLSDNFKMVFGLKAAFSGFENDVSTDEFILDEWIALDQFTNFSDLTEKIYAGYSSADYNLDSKNSFKFGLRYEYTDSKLSTIKDGIVVDRQFGKLFPSLFYSRKIDENQSINLAYNKRITRPTFNQMAPFAIFLDPNTFFFGNAGLQPAITDNFKFDYRYKSYLVSVQYALEDSTIARFQDKVVLESNQQAFEPVNLSQTKTLSGSLSVPIYIGNYWTMQNNFVALWSENNSFYNNELVELEQFSYNLNSSQSFMLGSGYSTEITGFYRSAGLFGRSIIDPIYGVNFGLQKQFKSGSSLRFSIRDILNSIEFRGGTNLPEQGFITDGFFDFSNRTFSLTYSTTFGNDKLKAARNRTTGAAEESNRVQ